MPLRREKPQYAHVPTGDFDSALTESASFLVKSPPGLDTSRRPWYGVQDIGRSRSVWVHAVLGVVWIVAFSSLLFLRSKSDAAFSPDRTSPLFSTLSYSKTRFTSGFEPDLSVYQGKPNKTNNSAWDKLTHVGIVTLTEAEHTELPAKTSLFTSNDTKESDLPLYVGAVEVFHQLHCLDMLRMEVYGVLDDWYREHSPKNTHTKPGHIEHCIDYIRQSMMCRPSLDILPFSTDASGLLRPAFNETRVCANFDNVRDWAIKRKAGNLTPQ